MVLSGLIELQGLAHEAQRSVLLKLLCVCEGEASRKPMEKGFQLHLFSPYQPSFSMLKHTKLITNKDLRVDLGFSQSKLPKLC